MGFTDSVKQFFDSKPSVDSADINRGDARALTTKAAEEIAEEIPASSFVAVKTGDGKASAASVAKAVAALGDYGKTGNNDARNAADLAQGRAALAEAAVTTPYNHASSVESMGELRLG